MPSNMLSVMATTSKRAGLRETKEAYSPLQLPS
jgi:hypothetical protein